jgi:hypothetical protein
MPLLAPAFISPTAAARQLLNDDSWFMGNCTVYRRDALVAIGGFPVELGAFTDGYVCRLLALKHGACFSPEVLGAWRRMEGGMAWSQAMNLESTRKLVAIVQQKMAAESSFPPKYARWWARRYLFGAKRFMLSHRIQRKRLLQRVLANVRAWLLICIWFISLRPFDAFAVLRRRLSVFCWPVIAALGLHGRKRSGPTGRGGTGPARSRNGNPTEAISSPLVIDTSRGDLSPR